MLPRWATSTATIIRPAETTRRGTTVHDWTNATQHTISGCQLVLSTTATDTDPAGRDSQLSTAKLLCPPNSDVQEHDRVTIDGRTWAVNGVPMERVSPTGRVSHLAVPLTERTG